ncbi:Flp family type IVb pilin [Arenibacterium sp. LLYu02]|uniref:Flp family type IVb pilin n=1 Tax=Arenibacterium sp. LLYu02 TaxID=3404132 RepID=UPI003B2158AE
MTKLFKNFRNDESGAVTVDWVVLCAAVVLLAGAVITNLNTGVEAMSTNTATFLSDKVIGE